MKVSLNTIKQFIDFELPSADELKKRINEQLGKVESVTDLAAKYKDAVIVRVVSAEKHPNADKLSVCWVDDGGVTADVSRNESGHVQVVCGAPNVHADMFAIWLPPKATVPASYDDTEPFVLSARELRGVVSQGMLAAADELAVGSDHGGIIELTDADLAPGAHINKLVPGLNFAETFGLDDVIFDIENKMFTHRPDCFGQLGVAREIAGILGHAFKSPAWYSDAPVLAQASGLDLTVLNEAPEKVPRLMAVAMSNVTVGPSPFWLQAVLVRWGSKPINNVVDLTNYIMLLTAQPAHAYDYDKLSGHKLVARMAEDGESARLLNGKAYALTTEDIVIADGAGVVGVAGIMGGGDSEVDANTKNIVLEVANFDMYTVRKTSMRHGLFTDALTRFNKGQSPLQNDRVLAELQLAMARYSGATQASQVFDMGASLKGSDEITLMPDFINTRLGSNLTGGDMYKLLENVEFVGHDNTSAEDKAVTVTAPFWRTDIELPEDIVEEIGRLYGFDKLPKELPKRSVKPVAKNAKREVARLVRESLARSGANEVLTYSFVHKNVIDRAGQDATKAFKLGNALSPDLQYYRLSVLPSLIDKVHGNSKAGHDEFMLFEIGKAHNKDDMQDDLPNEIELVDAIYASKKPKDGAAYYYVRRIVTQLARDLGFTLQFVPADDRMNDSRYAMFEPSRSALVMSRHDEFIGVIGELKQTVAKAFKLPEYVAAMSLELHGLKNAHEAAGAVYAPLSRFPSVTQDISLRVSADASYEDVFWTVWSSLKDSKLDKQFTPTSIYRGEDMSKKTITLSLQFTSHDKTLTSADIAPLMETIANAAKEQLGAELV